MSALMHREFDCQQAPTEKALCACHCSCRQEAGLGSEDGEPSARQHASRRASAVHPDKGSYRSSVGTPATAGTSPVNSSVSFRAIHFTAAQPPSP